MWDLIIACAEPWGSSGGMLWLIKTPAHQHPSNGGEPLREWTKGNRSLRALPVEGPISISLELILTAHSHSNRSSQGEEELMWSPYWLLPLLCFWLYPDQHMGLDGLDGPDHPDADMCCIACTRHKLDETPRLGETNIIESKERVFNISYRGIRNISL